MFNRDDYNVGEILRESLQSRYEKRRENIQRFKKGQAPMSPEEEKEWRQYKSMDVCFGTRSPKDPQLEPRFGRLNMDPYRDINPKMNLDYDMLRVYITAYFRSTIQVWIENNKMTVLSGLDYTDKEVDHKIGLLPTSGKPYVQWTKLLTLASEDPRASTKTIDIIEAPTIKHRLYFWATYTEGDHMDDFIKDFKEFLEAQPRTIPV